MGRLRPRARLRRRDRPGARRPRAGRRRRLDHPRPAHRARPRRRTPSISVPAAGCRRCTWPGTAAGSSPPTSRRARCSSPGSRRRCRASHPRPARGQPARAGGAASVRPRRVQPAVRRGTGTAVPASPTATAACPATRSAAGCRRAPGHLTEGGCGAAAGQLGARARRGLARARRRLAAARRAATRWWCSATCRTRRRTSPIWLRDSGEHVGPATVERYDAWLAALRARRHRGVGFGYVSLHRTGAEPAGASLEDWPHAVEQPLARTSRLARASALAARRLDDARAGARPAVAPRRPPGADRSARRRGPGEVVLRQHVGHAAAPSRSTRDRRAGRRLRRDDLPSAALVEAVARCSRRRAPGRTGCADLLDAGAPGRSSPGVADPSPLDRRRGTMTRDRRHQRAPADGGKTSPTGTTRPRQAGRAAVAANGPGRRAGTRRLVIVESPTKAKKIAGYLGDGLRRRGQRRPHPRPADAQRAAGRGEEGPVRASSRSTSTPASSRSTSSTRTRRRRSTSSSARSRTPTSSCSRRTRTARARRSPGT